ncbi:MAG: hypothetical protein IJT94_11110 [Oscillibacter sp.]|nr:hypothetical protein [Oscillibacter sp.]
MAQDRFYLAESLFYTAASAGIKGADVLLFSLYAEHMDEAGDKKLLDAFRRVMNIDLWSESIGKEVSNEIFLGDAMVEFAIICYRASDDRAKATDMLLRIINSDRFDQYEQIKKYARDSLMRLKSGK